LIARDPACLLQEACLADPGDSFDQEDPPRPGTRVASDRFQLGKPVLAFKQRQKPSRPCGVTSAHGSVVIFKTYDSIAETTTGRKRSSRARPASGSERSAPATGATTPA
jgi:hypothetical protein